MKKLTPAEQKKQELLDLCERLEQHVRLARDYATTPGNNWMARDELNTLGRLVADLETKLAEIEHSESNPSD